MNFRRMMVSGVHLWKRACTTVAGPQSALIETSYALPTAEEIAKARVETLTRTQKKIMLLKLVDMDARRVKETIDKFKSDYKEQKERKRSNPVSVTKSDLYRWAKLLEKNDQPEHAVEIFEWMEGKKMSFTAAQLAVYAGVIAKTKDYQAAFQLLRKVDPNWNHMDKSSKNWPASQKLLRMKEEEDELSRVTYLNFVIY